MNTNKTFLLVLLIGCFFSRLTTLRGQPTLSFATYLGGSSNDFGRVLTKDVAGNIFIAGTTNSTSGVATTGGYQTVYGGGGANAGDAFLAKFSSAGTLLWATYFGGSNNEQGLCVSTDNTGNVYLGGYTRSAFGVSTSGGFQPMHGGSDDAFLAKFSSTGSLMWATYYGGAGKDQANSLAVDNNGNIFMGGITRSDTCISTAGAHQPTLTSMTADEAFLVKFDSSGNRLWGTYYGGSGNDNFNSIGCDAWGNIYASGRVTANSTTGIASLNAFQPTYGGGTYDGVLVKFDSAGNRIWGTYYGGSLVDQPQKVLVTDTSGLFLSGITTSPGMNTATAWQTIPGGQADAFIARFDTSGQRIWATYYGGSALDQGDALVTDNAGHLYLCGVSASTSGIAIPGIIKDTVDVRDMYVAKFTTGGVRLWGTYIGGDNTDAPYSALYSNGQIFITGQTNSLSNFATTNAYQSAAGGGGSYDAFLVRVSDCPPLTIPSGITGDTLICTGATSGFSTSVLPNAQNYTWTLPTGWSFTGSSTGDSISVVVGTAGSILVTDTIKVRANYLCGSSADTFLLVTIAPKAQITPAGTQRLCSGDSLNLYATTAMVNSWQWLHNGNAIAATDSFLSVTQSGIYTVITTNAACSDSSDADTVILNPLPQPIVSMSGNILTTGNYIAYQWYHNGTTITGATNQTYTMITMTGIYDVEVTDTNGCKGMSADYIPTGISSLNAHPEIRLYPNPVEDVLVIDAPYAVAITLTSIDGKVLQQRNNAPEVDMSGYAAGWYLLRICDAKGNYIGTSKVLKQ